MRRVDLHIHTNASDGELDPASLVLEAAKGGLDLIAITDHDTIAGVGPAIEAAKKLAQDELISKTSTIVPGIEVSSTLEGRELHFLGYQIDHTHHHLADFAKRVGAKRHERMRGMVDKLNALGIEITYDEVIEGAGEENVTIGRPHLARALVAKNVVGSTAEAFQHLLADDGPAFLPTELMRPEEAIALITEVGGIPVWAHPPLETLEREIDTLVEAGLQGLEAYRPRNPSRLTERILEMASERDLLITGGSDWHGEWNGPLGDFSVAESQISYFLREAGLE